jgi:uridine kinase
MASTLTIGIAGGTGSGKTTITRRIQRQFGPSVCTLYHDNYYKAHDDIPLEDRAKINYDDPAAFDTWLLAEHLHCLQQGLAIQCPTYDYAIHNRLAQTVTVEPAPVILVEGILILENQQLCDAMDIKVFVDADADVRILRRITRDVRDRGRSLESVMNQYLTTVKPMHEKYVEPSRRQADVIIPQGGHNEVAITMLIERIRAHLKQEETGNGKTLF